MRPPGRRLRRCQQVRHLPFSNRPSCEQRVVPERIECLLDRVLQKTHDQGFKLSEDSPRYQVERSQCLCFICGMKIILVGITELLPYTPTLLFIWTFGKRNSG